MLENKSKILKKELDELNKIKKPIVDNVNKEMNEQSKVKDEI